jgi:hypothetical protein
MEVSEPYLHIIAFRSVQSLKDVTDNLQGNWKKDVKMAC